MTLESYPPNYSSVNGDLVYVFYDSNAANPTTYPNYKYVGEVWINGIKVFTGKAFPHPTTNRGIFNFGSVIREYTEMVLDSSATGILLQEFGEAAYRSSVVIKIREEYSGTVGAVVLTDSERVFYNYYTGRYSNFESMSAKIPVMSDRPLTLSSTFGSKYLLLPYYAATTSSYTVAIYNGTSTYTKTITPSIGKSLQQLNISATAINIESAGFITSSMEYYTVTVGGVTYKVNLICNGMFSNYKIHFLNKWGGFETMLFNKARKKSIEIEQKKYQQLGYRVNGSGVVSVKSGDIMHPQASVYSSSFKEKLKISTDWISDSEYIWLSQLVSSPYVYLEDTDNTLYPVCISESNYEIKEYITSKLSNLSLNIDFGQQYKTQFR